MIQKHVTGVWLLFLLSSPSWAGAGAANKGRQVCQALQADQPQIYGYQVVAEFAHDPTAFLQGAPRRKGARGASGKGRLRRPARAAGASLLSM
jgi:hypothetical protein